MRSPEQLQPSAPTSRAEQIHRRRWAILAVLSLSVFVTVVDGTIVNVTLPSLAVELGASTRQLQWIVDAYLLVFAGLLLAAGGLGDRFGRRRTLVLGLLLFGATSAFAGSASSANELIFGRALMGVGAALVFPATLAILTNVFTDPSERARAIGVWSGVTGLAVAAGPITGGWLLEHFWWGSVFYINLPVVVVAVVAAFVLVPESKEEDAPALDIVGLILSVTSITALILTIIEAPEWGWLSARTGAGFIVASALVTSFVRWELRTAHPMLPVRIFSNLRFSAASAAITSAFFALFGFIFLVTQYFQLVQGYTPLEAGVRTLPVAFSIAIASVMAPRVVERVGTTLVVMTGLTMMAITFTWISANSATTSYPEIVGQMILLGGGLGLTTAPATESIMGSLSVDKAGIGSAVNDTTRELGGTLGVAVVGSVFSSVYTGALADGPVFSQLSAETRAMTEESVGAAALVAGGLGPTAPAYMAEVSDAFMSGFGVASLVVAGVAGAGAVFAAKFLPAHAPDLDTELSQLQTPDPEFTPQLR